MEGYSGLLYRAIQSGIKKTQDPKEVKSKKRTEVPIWQKDLLTLEEAAEYTGLGVQKLRDISNDENCEFVLWNGTKRMFKRRKLEDYLEAAFSV